LVRYAMTRTTVVAWGSFGWVLLSALVSLELHDWVWFQRSGAVLTVAAVAMAGRAMVRTGRAGLQRSGVTIATVGASYIDKKSGKPIVVPQFTPQQKRAQQEDRRDDTAAVLAFFFAIFGTAIWGYGDLFNLLYPHH